MKIFDIIIMNKVYTCTCVQACVIKAIIGCIILYMNTSDRQSACMCLQGSCKVIFLHKYDAEPAIQISKILGFTSNLR